MGEAAHAGVFGAAEVVPDESVTGVGGPVLLARTAQELERGDVLAGRYQIEALLGSGGSGRVLRAFDRVARELVALKILRPEYASDPVWAERFSRELRVGRQIQHRNVCRIFDIGEADGHRFLSMELATRGTVRGQIGPAALDRPLEARIADVRALIEGVAALHAAGIVHRDLKPENLLRMEDGRLVVSDFGLATDPGAGPATTIMIGTPRYMAQEVVMGEPATTRSDVWALGVVMHEMLFGCRPDRSVVNRGIRRYTPPKVDSLRERRLAEVCGRCTEDYPDARPASADEVRRAFEAAVLGRQFKRDLIKRQVAWGAVAASAIAALWFARDHWTNRAIASSPAAVASLSSRDVKVAGLPADWSTSSTRLASFDGPVHCVDSSDGGKLARVIWGRPRRAEQVDLRTGAVISASLFPGTFDVGCPQTSPDGKGLLFEKSVDGARQIFLSPHPDGSAGRFLTLGSTPKWLPNGQEFVFDLDARHGAVFSLSTRQISIVAATGGGPSSLEDKAVDQSGSRLALLYSSESLQTRIVVVALPELEVVRTISVPTWARGLRFAGKNELLFTVVGSKGMRQLVSADLEAGRLDSVAETPGTDLQGFIPQTGLMTSRKRFMDLWLLAGENRSRLTSDGQSVGGSLNRQGDLLIQRFLPDGREVIVFRNANGHEAGVTDGPSDVTPSFLPNGRGWLFTRLSTGQILECAGPGRSCVVVHTDPLVPNYPRTDPSGRWIGYVTALNNSRVRLFSRVTGEQRDLGASTGCPPVWASANRLWIATSENAQGQVWSEMDVEHGRPSGRTRLTKDDIREEDCNPPKEILPEGAVRVVGKFAESSTLWRRAIR